tara:strand:- start:1004 stop:1981 length:978 start_codon:yes stop_codon:yes gene_type:complete
LLFNCLFIFFSSLFLTNKTIPFVKNKAEKLNVFDKPEVRKQHTNSMVRLGGISILFGFLMSLFLYDIFFQTQFILTNFKLLAIILGFFLTGIVDDIFKTSPWTRLIIEIVLATFAWMSNFGIYAIDFSFSNSSDYLILLPKILSYLITLFWIVGITNAINWIDGLDGLASGIVCICAIGMTYISFDFSNFNEVIFLVAIIGVCVGFLKSNFFPAKILMGDGGSYLLGFCIAILSIQGSTRNLDYNSDLISTSILIPFIILSLPLLDMTYVILKRIYLNKSPFYPDRNHLHHRLIDYGLTHRNAVLFMYLLNIFNVLLVIFLKRFL